MAIKKNYTIMDRLAYKMTRWVGTTESVVAHTIFFVLCFIPVLFGARIETMLLLLTTVVSLEAIYLSLFIQISVNRQEKKLKDVHEDVEDLADDLDELKDDESKSL